MKFFEITYIRFSCGNTVRCSGCVRLTPGCTILGPVLRVGHALVPLAGVEFGPVDGLDVFSERRGIGVTFSATRSPAGVRFLKL